MKKGLLIIAAVLLILGVLVFIYVHGITKKIFIPRTSSTAVASGNSIADHLASKTPFNAVLLGYGGGNHDGAYLTDSIIVIHVDPKVQKTYLISIPRDIWIKIPTNGADGSYSKINAAYQIGLEDSDYPNKDPQFTGADGGGRLAEYVVQKVTGLPITYFIGMDFSGFTHTIDTLGGVDINVQTTFDDYSYPITGKEDDLCGMSQDSIASFSAQIATGSAVESDIFGCRFEHLHFDAGQQHMDGTTALKYVRSRHSLQDGTDFGRAQRQRNLIVAVKQKVFSADLIPRVIPFMSSLGDDLRTDMSPDDVKTFIQNADTLNKYQIVSLALTDQNFLTDTVSSDGQDILQSRDGIDDWTSVHNYLTDEFSGKSQPVSAVVQVENGTSSVGLAQIATNRLKDANVQVLEPTDAPTKTVTQTTITASNSNISPHDIAALKKEFGVNSIKTSTDTTQNNYNVLVVVGSDYNTKQGKKLLNEP